MADEEELEEFYDPFDGFLPVQGFDGYLIDQSGTVVRERTGRHIRPSYNQQGRAYVSFQTESGWHNKALSLLVAKTFIRQPFEHFNSVIHHDYDFTNCAISNLSWRPRWFAVSYHRQGRSQYDRMQFYNDDRAVVNLDTLQEFENVWEASMFYGLLILDLVDSMVMNKPVFPLHQMFGYKRW